MSSSRSAAVVGAPVGPSGLRRFFRRAGLTAVLAVVLSGVLIFNPRTTLPAEAFVPAVPVIVAGGAMASPGTAAAAGAACATGIGCVAVGAVVVAGALYMTRDSWMPTVSGWLGKLKSKDNTAAGGEFQMVAVQAGPAPHQLLVSVQMSWLTGTNAAGWVWDIDGRIRAQSKCLNTNGSTATTYTSTTNGGTGAQVAANDGGMSMPNGGAALTGKQMGGQMNRQFIVDLCAPGTVLAPGFKFVMRALHNSTSPTYTQEHIVDKPEQDPSLTRLQSTANCVDAGGVTRVITSDVMVGAGDKIPVPSCQAYGWIPTSLNTKDLTTGQTVGDWTIDNPLSQYGNCFTGTTITCTTRVFIDGESCTVSGHRHCVDWWEWSLEHPTRFDCKFGSYVVPRVNCAPLKRAYPEASPGVSTTVDVAPLPDGEFYPDPDHTGSPSPNPQPPTSTPTTGTGIPTTGTNPTSPPATPDPTSNPDDTQGCMGANWSWNPVSWVYAPVKCALIWAFVPSDGFWDQAFGDLQNTLDATPFDEWGSAVASIFSASPGAGGVPITWSTSTASFTSGEGCTGPGVSWDGFTDTGNDSTIYPVSACSGIAAQVAVVVRTLLMVVVGVGAFMKCVGIVMSSLGFTKDTPKLAPDGALA